MLSKQSISFFTIGSAMFFGAASIALASNELTTDQSEKRTLIIAQAQHQHGQEKGDGQGGGSKHTEGHQGEGNKHGHGHSDQSGHGGHGEGKGGHDREKEEKGGHGDKKNHGMKKDSHDYAHLIVAHADTLKLSDEQLGKIVRFHLKHEQEHERLKEKVKKSMKAFKKESMNPGASDDQLSKLGKDHADAFKAMVDFHIKERKDIHSILTESQRKTLETLKMDHDHDGHDSHGGKHGGHDDH
ncbi:MAG: hypothetical protein E6Q62_11525 [Nitrosomonas sp.]|nr:MAG: hypothetical protein E6Q62_11525 [Nitrosomonas sp.]